MVPAAYREILAIPTARLPLVASAIGRLPLGSEGLAILFLVREATDSFAAAGAVEAAFSVGAAIGVPLQGRLVDRVGQTRVLLPAAAVNVLALALLVVAAHTDAAVATLAVLGAYAGVSVPALSSCMRGLWAHLCESKDLLQSAYALDAVIIELAFIMGPLLAAGLAAAISPSVAVLAGGAFSLVGTASFVTSRASRAWRSRVAAAHWAGALRAPGIWVLAVVSIGFGFANGALVLALSAFGRTHGATEIVGPLISIQAVASMVGGFWFGARQWAAAPEDSYPRLNLLLALGFAPLILVPSVPVMAGLMVLAGLAIAPATAVEYLLIDRIAPPGTSTEAFGWVITATVLGSGMGAAVSGAIVSGGHLSLAFLAAFAGAAIAWLASTLGRPALRPAVEPA